jgi:hypothetical protein
MLSALADGAQARSVANAIDKSEIFPVIFIAFFQLPFIQFIAIGCACALPSSDLPNSSFRRGKTTRPTEPENLLIAENILERIPWIPAQFVKQEIKPSEAIYLPFESE